MKILLICALLGLTTLVTARRVRVRPLPSSDESEDVSPSPIAYYSQEEEDVPTPQRAVLVARQDNYGRATGQPRLTASPKLKPSQAKAPPVQTIRNYNKLNDDGSFTFGYEAADGSFKEETRGTDCVVRGKYGYVDPDGNKREFTYVSGNPCDPNAVQDEDDEPLPNSGEENVPQNIPLRRPIPKSRPTPTTIRPRPTQTVFQQQYSAEDENSAEEENIPRPSPRPVYRVPSFAQLEEQVRPQPQLLRATPAPAPTPRPKLLVSSQRPQSVSITPRPTQPPATTYRPQLVRIEPQSPKTHRPLDLDEELRNFQLEHNAVTTPRAPSSQSSSKGSSPIYTSELVYDRNSGQYNTVLYQQLPQTHGDFNLRGSLQPFVQPQQQQQYFQQPTPRPFIARGPPPPAFAPQPRPQPIRPQPQSAPHFSNQQELFRQQQSLALQQSQQLYAAQQKKKLEQPKFPASLLQQEPQRFSSQSYPQYRPQPAPQQPFYFVSPNGDRTSLSNGQIDAFLRGHSIAL